MKLWIALFMAAELIGAVSLMSLAPHLVPKATTQTRMTDADARLAVVRTMGLMSMCTGFSVQAPSGKKFILTAKHCQDQVLAGKILVKPEHGDGAFRKMIAVSESADLMLIEGLDGLPAFKISPTMVQHERIKAFSHGHDMDTYETTGELVQEMREPMPGSNDHVEVSTVSLLEGSSGCPILDQNNEIVGVGIAIDGSFSYLARLQDIQDFIKNR